MYTAKATDLDSGNNGKITYSIYQAFSEGSKGTLFKIDQNTGQLSLVKPLNYEATEEHIVIIKAQDNGARTQHFSKNATVIMFRFNN